MRYDRKRERATSGISGERDPGEKRKGPDLSFFLTRPHSSPARFFNPPLTESLEQASFALRAHSVAKVTGFLLISSHTPLFVSRLLTKMAGFRPFLSVVYGTRRTESRSINTQKNERSRQ